MLAFTRFEVVRTVRDARFVGFLVAFPVAMYLLFVNGDARGRPGPGGLDGAALALVGLACYAAAGAAMYSGGPRLAFERATGWTRQLRVTPLSERAWLCTKVVQGLLLVVPGLLAVAAVALLYGGVRLSPGRWAGFAAVTVLGAVPFVFVGLLVGLLLDGQAAHLGQVATLMGTSVVGGLFVPLGQLPHGVQVVGRCLPTHHVAELGRAVLAGRPPDPVHAAWIVGWTVPLTALVLALHRRLGRA
jgi:ABC-2 type transport system permease protein